MIVPAKPWRCAAIESALKSAHIRAHDRFGSISLESACKGKARLSWRQAAAAIGPAALHDLTDQEGG